MKFKRVSVGGKIFGDNETDDFTDEELIEEYRSAPVSQNYLIWRLNYTL